MPDILTLDELEKERDRMTFSLDEIVDPNPGPGYVPEPKPFTPGPLPDINEFMMTRAMGTSPDDLSILDKRRSRFKELVDAAARGIVKVQSGFSTTLAGAQQKSLDIARPGKEIGTMKSPVQEKLFESEQERVDRLRAYGDLMWEIYKDPELASQNRDLLSQVINMGAETIPYITWTTLASLAAGPFGGFAVGSMVEGNSAYREALDAGVSDENAKAIGIGVGIICGAIERVGGKVTDKAVAKIAAKLKNQVVRGTADLTLGSLTEAMEEATQEWAQMGGEAIYRDIDADEAIRRTLTSAGGGFLLGGAFKTTSSAVRGLSSMEAKLQSQEEQGPLTNEELVKQMQEINRQTGGKMTMQQINEQVELIRTLQESELEEPVYIEDMYEELEDNLNQAYEESQSKVELNVTEEGDHYFIEDIENFSKGNVRAEIEALQAKGKPIEAVVRSDKADAMVRLAGMAGFKEIGTTEQGGRRIRWEPSALGTEPGGKETYTVEQLLKIQKEANQSPKGESWVNAAKRNLQDNKHNVVRIGYDDNGKPFIIDGNARIQAAKELGIDSLPVEVEKTESITPEPAAQEGQAGRVAKGEEPNITQRDILGGVDPVQTLKQTLEKSKQLRPMKEAEIKAERRKRAGKMMGTMKYLVEEKGMKFEDAIWRSTSQLKGAMSNVRFEPVRQIIEDAQPGAVDSLFQSIYASDKLRPYDIVDTSDALRSLLDGEVITMRQYEMIRNHFGIEIGKIARPRVAPDALVDKLIALRNAGLLTGMKTSDLNMMSNLSHGLTEVGKDIPASVVDTMVSWFTGERTVVFNVKGTKLGIKEGIQKGWEYLKTGVDERRAAEKYDWRRVNFGTSKFAKALQIYEGTIYHLMGGEDMPFYYTAKARSLFNQAYAQAKTQGLTGKARTDYVNKMVANPTDTMLEYAVHDAEVAVFQNRTALGDIAANIQKSRVGKLIVPFGRTPSAVAMQVVNYSPVGGVKTIWEQVSKGKFDQRTFSQGMGRATLGTGVIALGAHMFAQGLVSTEYPDNEKERNLWQVEGRKPNSIKINGKWRDVQVLGPAGNLIMIGAYFQDSLNKTGSPSEAIVTAMAGGAKSFSNQTFVTGINQTVEAITDPERSFEKWFSSMAGSAVPTIVADIARAMDTTERRTRGPVERIESRIPIVREGLEPKLDVFGQDLPRYGGNPLEVMVDPTRPFKIKHDIVVDELRRLWDKGLRVSPAMIGNKNGYPGLTPQENTALWRRAGELTYKAIYKEIQSKVYKSLEDEGSISKANRLKAAIKKSTDLARAEMAYIKNNQGVPEQQLWESGLMNNDVFKHYLTTVKSGLNKQELPK